MEPGKAGASVLAWRPLPGARDEEHALAVRLLAELAAVSVERARLTRQKIELEAMAATERLRTALMSSISHDFRTPLSTILASSSSLMEFDDRLAHATRMDMLAGIQEEAERLNRFIRNILDMTRLEADVLKPLQEWTDPLELLETATERVRKRLGARSLNFATPAAAPSIYVDRILAEQALANVLENAIVHTQGDAAIRVGSDYSAETVSLWVEDDGPGVKSGQLDRIFDKFQRVGDAGAAPHGVGLGLAISKGFVEAMAGRVEAVSPARGERGLRVVFSFPRQLESAPA
jgi:two-component system sensor histidine kinase KdpD